MARGPHTFVSADWLSIKVNVDWIQAEEGGEEQGQEAETLGRQLFGQFEQLHTTGESPIQWILQWIESMINYRWIRMCFPWLLDVVVHGLAVSVTVSTISNSRIECPMTLPMKMIGSADVSVVKRESPAQMIHLCLHLMFSRLFTFVFLSRVSICC